MAIHDEPDSTLFRWDLLERAQRISLSLTMLVSAVIAILVIYTISLPPSSAAGSAPHAWVRLPAFLAPPTPTPLPTAVPTPTPTPLRIGIVSGHRGYDSGAICADGLTEAEVNFDIAQRVAAALRMRGYIVDILEEYDSRLTDYRALLLLSIHADSCEFINEEATGFKVARVLNSHVPEAEDRLVKCLSAHYAARTGLPFHANSITPDMTSYHGFYEIAPETPAAIIETGFLYLDRPLLTQHPELVSGGIVDGIVCFLTGGP
ncbi:MAG: N-acetylmuramoyl-L-alanine amidase [Thermoflexales bacterium]|nr:N-acetylmuramoyl-L-alanine amidase [Thermoflexales bacterium]